MGAAGARYTSVMEKPSLGQAMDGAAADDAARPLAALEALPARRALPCLVDGRPVLLYRQGTGVRAVVNRCPHVGTPLDLSPGNVFTLDGRHLICATHGALFEPDSGLCVSGPCKGRALEIIPLLVRDGQVWPAGRA